MFHCLIGNSKHVNNLPILKKNQKYLSIFKKRKLPNCSDIEVADYNSIFKGCSFSISN